MHHKINETCVVDLLNCCEIHVECDEDCHALEKPKTLAEHKATLEHYKNHSYLSGCSHGY